VKKWSESPELLNLGKRLAGVRQQRGLTQRKLADRSGLQQEQIAFFEIGSRIPSLAQLLRIARALDLPLQHFLTGSDWPESGIRGIALELRALGLVDLWVESPLVPGAFRRPEEVMSRAVAGEDPEARIVEGVPAVLAWNRWDVGLLRAFGRAAGPRVVHRLAWLADIALVLDRMGGFPGGCPGKDDLTAFTRKVTPPRSERWDDLGKPSADPPASPVWKRWKINYAADLTTFRERAQSLVSLRAAESGGTQHVPE
jgi:transcriptional regulator with XRE-family HTH domain